MSIGNKNLLKKRFDYYYPFLCKIANKYINSRDECEDIVQETFISIWQKNKHNLPEKDFAPYIIKAVKNNCISFIRKQKNINAVELDTNHLSIPDTSILYVTDTGIGSYAAEERIMQLLSVLPTKCKQVFIMSKLHKLKYREIAINLGISEKTVENHIAKAIKILRQDKLTQKLILISAIALTLIIIL